MKTRKVSSWALILISAVLTFLMVLMVGIAIANAENQEKAIDTPTDSQIFKDANAPSDLPTGIQIWKSTGQPAEKDTDYQLLTDPYGLQPSQIKLISDKLTVEGGGWSQPVDIGLFADTNTGCNNLTIKNLYLNYKGNHSAIRVDLPKATDVVSENFYDAFNLNVIGECYIYQLGQQKENNRAICFEQGRVGDNVNIIGISDTDTKAKLECYTNIRDTIFSNMAEITFDGKLNALAYVTDDAIIQGDVIDWSKEAEDVDNNNLTIKGDAELYVGNESTKDETCIYAGTIKVWDKASLYAVNNCTTTNLPVVKAQDNIIIDTEGEVFIDAYNEKSWQAIECNYLTINKCSGWFTAIAHDYTAIECRGDFTIGEDAIEKIYMSGSFVPNDTTDNRAHRAAFTIKHPRNFIVPEGYLMYGSEELNAAVENINQRAVATFSSGLDSSYSNTPEYDIYTPVLANLTGELPEYANSVIFKPAKEVVFVPGQNASYDNAGYKDCFKYKNEDIYFEDYDQQIKIYDYDQWRAEGGNGYIPSVKQDFNDCKHIMAAECDSLIERGDTSEIRYLIESAKAAIANYRYDEESSLPQNKAVLQGILNQLVLEIDTLPLPIPDPMNWVPGSGVESLNIIATSQTGDRLALLIIALFVIAALLAGFMIYKKKNIHKVSYSGKHIAQRVIYSPKIIVISVAVITSLLLFAGLAIAHASTNNQIAANANNPDASLYNTCYSNYEAYDGITILNAQGQPAIEGKDFVCNTIDKTIDIKTDGLVVTGGSKTVPVEVSIYVIPGVTDLTIKNLSIISHKKHDNKYGNTLTIDLNSNEDTSLVSSSMEGPWNAPDEDFTLTVLGSCYISQTDNTQGGSAIYVNEGGSHGLIITGTVGSYLETYTDYFESIYLHKVPLMFSGDLEAMILSDGDRCIHWRDQHGTDMLFVTDNVKLTCGTSTDHKYQAIQCGSMFVIGNASLYAVNNNGFDADSATINVRHFFGINTTGNVYVGNVSDKSWQAIICERIAILNCNDFVAFSSDYTAIDVSESMTIQTPNVTICGEYNREETTNKARKGAFTIENVNQLYISPDLMVKGSVEAYDVPQTATSIMMVLTRGQDVSKLYTPVVCDGNTATIAKTIQFSVSAHNLVPVPGLNPTYSAPGYKECYQCRDCGTYYEDMQHNIQIFSLDAWRGPDGNGYIAPLTDEFDSYKAARREAMNNMLLTADTPEIRAMIEAAQAKIDAYVYDDSISMTANKNKIDLLYQDLYIQVGDFAYAEYINSANNVAQTGDNLALYVFALISLIAIAGATTLTTRKK